MDVNNNSERATMGGKPVFTVPSKSVINLDSGFRHKLLCDGPTFSAGTFCVYSCAFCYVPAQMKKQEAWLREHGVVGKPEDIVVRRQDAVATVRRQLTDSRGHPKFDDMKDARVIYGSPLVDVAGNMELVRETVEICKTILSLTHWQIRLLSKSNLLPVVARKLDAWRRSVKQRVIYGVSTGTLDDRLAACFECGTAMVSKRIESLHWLQDNGYRTFGMVCPSLPQRDYTGFAASMRDALRYDRLEHVWCEVMNARGDSFKNTHAALEAAGYADEASMLYGAAYDDDVWEAYSRSTFAAHAACCPPEKLRFMQYVTNDTRPWWEANKEKGVVVL